jgi:hypothetical protein
MFPAVDDESRTETVRTSTLSKKLAVRTLPFVPVLAVLGMIHRFAVNVPTNGEWGLVPVLWQRPETPGWAHLLGQRLGAAKTAAAALALVTNFDVTAGIYAGVCLQLLAFIFLWSVLELTLRAWHRRLIAPLAVAIALLMFSVRYDQTWFSGLTSLQSGITNLAVAVVLWLMTRWPRKPAAIVVSLALSWIATDSLRLGAMLWCLVVTALVTQSLAGQKIEWRRLAARLTGVFVVAGVYLGGIPASATQPLVFISKPLQAWMFVLAYLGSPLIQFANSWTAVAAGAVGVILLALALPKTWNDAKEVRSILPWLWLCTYGVLSAIFAAVTQQADKSAMASELTAAVFFWIGLAVIVSLALHKRVSDQAYGRMGPAATIAVVVFSIIYANVYAGGYFAFRERQDVLTTGLLELYEYRSASDVVFELLGVERGPAIESLQVLERRALSLFSSRMLRERTRLEALPIAKKVLAGQGSLDVAQCDFVGGWAWDAGQPDVTVEVQIYDGQALLGSVAARRFRPDLLKAHVGSGRHGFLFTPPSNLKDGAPHLISVRISGVKTDLGSPHEVLCQ